MKNKKWWQTKIKINKIGNRGFAKKRKKERWDNWDIGLSLRTSSHFILSHGAGFHKKCPICIITAHEKASG